MDKKAGSLLRKPKCRYCGREWTPPRYVSSNHAYCSECRNERLALVSSKTKGFRALTGKTGEIAIVPIKV